MSDSIPPGKKRDWQALVMFAVAIGAPAVGVVTTWSVMGERIAVLHVHRDDHETRLRMLESNSTLATAVHELKAEIKVLTTKNEALEKQVAALVAQRERQRR